MNEYLRYGLIFVGGLVVGAMAKQAIGENHALREAATNLLSRGMDIKDCVMSKVELIKESAEDMMAEAQSASEKRKSEAELEPVAQA